MQERQKNKVQMEVSFFVAKVLTCTSRHGGKTREKVEKNSLPLAYFV